MTTAYELFKQNNDYVDIVAFLHVLEAEVERLIHAERELRRLKERKRAARREAQRDWMRRHRADNWRLRAAV